MNAKVKCPTCKKESDFSKQNKFRPFCSERCRLIDLGNWADGSYHIAGPKVLDDSTDQNLNSDHDEDTKSYTDSSDSSDF